MISNGNYIFIILYTAKNVDILEIFYVDQIGKMILQKKAILMIYQYHYFKGEISLHHFSVLFNHNLFE